jgi:hypothetical protein
MLDETIEYWVQEAVYFINELNFETDNETEFWFYHKAVDYYILYHTSK